MAQAKLSAVALAVLENCGSAIGAAVNMQSKAEGKWKSAAKALYHEGVRVAMLTKPGKDEENPTYDEGVRNAIETHIIASLTATTKPMKFDYGTFTVAELLALTTAQLREAGDKVLSNTKRTTQQEVGRYFSLMVSYIRKEEDPEGAQRDREAARAAKAEKAKAEAPAVERSVTGYIAACNDMMANRNTLGLSARDAETIGDKLADLLGFLRSVKRADDVKM